MTFITHKKTVRLATLLYTGVILLLMALPINGENQLLGELKDNYVLQIRFDYISHMLMFVPWALMRAYGWQLHRLNTIQIGLYCLLALFFAFFCEYLQLLLPYRTFNIIDLVSNSLGVILGYALYWAGVRLSNTQSEGYKIFY